MSFSLSSFVYSEQSVSFRSSLLCSMKVVNLKQAILQAWKERWSDYQWAINIKKNCPKGATWDYLNLAGVFWVTLIMAGTTFAQNVLPFILAQI